MNTAFLTPRTQTLQQMAARQTMEQGSLKAEFRDSSSGERCGPYFKHQVWHDGGNFSRRMPPEEASALEAAIANRQRLESPATQFVELTVSALARASPRRR